MTDQRAEQILLSSPSCALDDAPTRGGRILSYAPSDPGLAVVDELARHAAQQVQHVNGPDPTTFGSVARMEADVIGFAAGIVHGDDAVGVVTSGGTEKLPAGGEIGPGSLAGTSPGGDRHAVDRRADDRARRLPQGGPLLRSVRWTFVPVGEDGTVGADDLLARCSGDTALVVVSAPCYLFGVIDPVADVAPRAAALGIACHVDACTGWVLPFWGEGLPWWDLGTGRDQYVAGRAQIRLFAESCVSVLLFAGPRRQTRRVVRHHRLARLPGGQPDRCSAAAATALAAAWAILEYLGADGLTGLTAMDPAGHRDAGRCRRRYRGAAGGRCAVGPAVRRTHRPRRRPVGEWTRTSGRTGCVNSAGPCSRSPDCGSTAVPRCRPPPALTVTPVTASPTPWRRR